MMRLFINIFLLSSSFIVAMESPVLKGDLFTAIPISENITCVIGDIQKELGDCFGDIDFSPSPANNLHMTIQVIDPVENQDSLEKYIEQINEALMLVSESFKDFAKRKGRNRSWDFASKLQSGELKINQHGIVTLSVGRSELLKQLGKIIDKKLSKVGIKTKRNDVKGIYKAHITLGLISQDKVHEAKSKKCDLNFKSKFKGHQFIIDSFVLLQSNRPEKVRQYYCHHEYQLSLDN